MNELEMKLGLVEQSPEEIIYNEPTAANLRYVPKTKQTIDMLEYVFKHDGLALQFAAKRLITIELCEIAVKQNGLALAYVPEKIIDDLSIDIRRLQQLYQDAVSSNGLALEHIPEYLIDTDMAKKAIMQEMELSKWQIYPIHYVPAKLLTDEILMKAVSYSPLCLRDIDKRRITKRIALTAISKNGLSLQYIPKRFITEDLVRQAISNNPSSVIYAPTEFVHQNNCNNYSDIVPTTVSSNSGEQNNSTRNNKDEEIRFLAEIVKGAIERTDVASYLYKDDIKTEIQNLTLCTPEIETNTTAITQDSFHGVIEHDFSEETVTKKVYYVSDIHIEHHLLHDQELQEQIKATKINEEKREAIKQWIDKKTVELVSGADCSQLLLIGGDVANSVELSQMFYNCLRHHWYGTILSVLGNHELWDGTDSTNWNDPCYSSRPVKEIVLNYKRVIEKTGLYIARGDTSEFYAYDCHLLENEVYIKYKNKKSCILSEQDIIDASDDTLADLLSKCSIIIIGGIGYSGNNTEYNAESIKGEKTKEGLGLYRKTITSLEEDRKRSEDFRHIHDKVIRCARHKKVIVLSHTQVEDWTNESVNNGCIYVNGHTHINKLTKTEGGTTILSDNQIGYGLKKESNHLYHYTNPKWKLNAFIIDRIWYDPFESTPDGIYIINSDSYKEFNIGRGIMSNGCNYDGTLYMLKRNKMYMFLLKSSKSLCLLSGGRRSKLNNRSVKYYYARMDAYCECVKKLTQPYQKVMLQISKEVIRIGGSGRIHGCIVDIDFYNHIYVNPFDGKITSYFAYDICGRITYNSFQQHLEHELPNLLNGYIEECKMNSIPLLQTVDSEMSLLPETALLPEWMYGTEMYDPSRIIRAVQYVWEQNVIRIWNDDLLSENGQHITLLQSDNRLID